MKQGQTSTLMYHRAAVFLEQWLGYHGAPWQCLLSIMLRGVYCSGIPPPLGGGNEIKGGEGFQGKGKERREGEKGKEGGEGEKGKGRRGREDEEGKQLRGMEEYLGKGTITGEGK